MKPKNVMLLGFVNRAVEYLDRHMDEQPDSKLTELKNIDLASLRDELSDNLDISLGTMQSTMATLLRAGNEAFDKFLDSNTHKEKQSLSEQFDKMFDVDFDDKKKNNQEELAKLLAFYNLDNDFGFEDDFEIDTPVKEEKEETVKENVVEVSSNNNEVDLKQEASKSEDINIESKDDIQVDDNTASDVSDDNFVSNDDEFMQEIIKNATSDDVEVLLPTSHAEDDSVEIDSLFNEIVSNEDYSNPGDGEYVSTLIEELRAQMIREDELIKKNKEIKSIPEENYKDDSSDVDQNENDDSNYINNLIDDLKDQFDKEEKNSKNTVNDTVNVYSRISELYPYLPNGFVRAVYDLKESFAREFPINIKLIIIHRIKFNDVENLRQFVEIGLSHGYTINADEKKMIVDIFREHINTDGKILTNIYEIANQGYLLNGIYDGYNVLINEDE